MKPHSQIRVCTSLHAKVERYTLCKCTHHFVMLLIMPVCVRPDMSHSLWPAPSVKESLHHLITRRHPQSLVVCKPGDPCSVWKAAWKFLVISFHAYFFCRVDILTLLSLILINFFFFFPWSLSYILHFLVFAGSAVFWATSTNVSKMYMCMVIITEGWIWKVNLPFKEKYWRGNTW